jgi:hypothetical protein
MTLQRVWTRVALLDWLLFREALLAYGPILVEPDSKFLFH